jgi:hypothetical protein
MASASYYGCRGNYRSNWGSRRYQGKIFGKEDSDEITVSHQARLHLKKQDVLLYVTSHADRHVTVLGSKTGSVTPVYRLL